MGILEKLRPQPGWKHADPAVRAAAVYELGPDEADALHTLVREDPEARVRRAAVTRIDAVAVLGEASRTDPDEEVRAEAVRGLAGIAAEADDFAQAIDAVRQLMVLGRTKEIVSVVRDSSSAEVRASVVDLLEDERSLGAISRHAQDGSTRLRALTRIGDGDELLRVALKAEHTDAAVAALDRITSAEGLASIGQRARNKVAGRRARAKLRVVGETTQPGVLDVTVRMSTDDRQRAQNLLQGTERLVALADPDEAGRALAEARLAWAEFQADAEIDSALVQQFESATEAVREAIAQRQQERAAEEERAMAVAREQADRVTICEEILALSGPGSADRFAELKVRWDGLSPIASEYALSFTRRFQDACRLFEDGERRRTLAAAAAGRLETLATELEQLARSEQAPDEVVARWRGLRRDATVLREHGSANPAAAERLERAVVQLEEQEQRLTQARARREEDNLRRLHQLCRQVETLAATEQITLKAADRAMRDVRSALEERAPLPSKKDRQDVHCSLEAARVALGPRLQELRNADEWQRWANLQVQERLCGEMETLQEEQDLEVAARRMRVLQTRWKQVALAPRAQGEVMWRRFKTAQDEVFNRTAVYFAAKNEQHAASLASKQALCERAEALSTSSDWVRTASEFQAIQAEWKTIGPVSRGREKAIWERFHVACDCFFKRRHADLKQRKEVWAGNLERKEALCAKSEALADSTDWESTASQMRQLQAEWKSIGPVRKSKSEIVWRRFRAACDRFFERYKYRDQVDLLAKAAPREAAIRELASLVPVDTTAAPEAPDSLLAVVQEARATWQQAPDLPRHVQEELARRYQQVLARLVVTWPDEFGGTDLDPEATRRRMEKLVAKVEESVSAEGQPAANLSPTEHLAQRLRERLAANTITRGRTAESEESRWREAEQELRSVQAQWARLGPVPADVAGPLNERFQRACQRFYEQRRKAS